MITAMKKFPRRGIFLLPNLFTTAALVAAFVWFSSDLELAGLGGLALAFMITLTAGMLMVSRFRYYSFKEVTPGRRIPFRYLIGIVLIFILIALDPPSVFLILFAIYASSGPIYWLWRKRAARPRQSHVG